MSTDEYALPGAILRYFDLASAPYPGGAAEDIKDRRKAAPGGKLFFDRLLEFAEIDGPSLYPPTTPAGFRRLLHAIHSTTRIDRLKRDCFLYYLVRDGDTATRPAANGDMDVDSSSEASDEDSGASEFVRRRCLPRTWRVFMDGYWLIDHGRWAEAVTALSDPAISELNFVPEIVSALTTLVSPPSESLRLVYELLDTRSPGSEAERNAALLAKAGVAGVSAAFAVVREQEQAAARAAGREAIWCWALGAPRTPCGKGGHTAQPRALKEMLHLAMHDEESAHLVGFLAHPPREVAPPARSLLHDLVTLRLVHAGKYEETLALDRELAGTDAASAADRQRRREMVREFIDILPEAQRRILLGEDYKRGAAAANGTVTVNGAPDGDVDMGDSWVHVDAAPVQSPANAAATAHAPSYADAAASPASPTAPAVAAAPSTPGPIAPQPVRLAQRALGIDGTPSRNGASSPFGGPPRFASPKPKAESTAAPSTTAGAPSTSSRQASPTRVPSPPAPIRAPSPPRSVPRASPFVQATPSSSKPARRPKRVINDDAPSLRRSTRQKSQAPEDEDRPARAMSRAPSEAPIPEDMPAPPAPPPSRPKRTTKKTTKKATEAADEVEQTTPKPRTKRTTRAASRASTVEPVDEHDDDDIKIPGAFGETPARRTRKAAKATLDEPHEDETPAKRTRAKATTRKGNSTFRAPSEAPSEVSETHVRRTRRTAASERGSPTPSVASTVGSPKKRTTRTTRSRKAAAAE